jgi:hypothetical protein
MNKTENILHIAICQAVGILNIAPEIAAMPDGRRVRDILRVALADYANAVMDEPVHPGEVEHMRKRHSREKRSTK